MSKMPTLLLGHGNPKNKDSFVDVLKNHKWHAFNGAECDRLIPQLRKVPHSRVHVTNMAGDRAKDTPILVRDRFERIGFSASRVSKALGEPGSELNRVAPARILSVADFKHPVAHHLDLEGIRDINVHPNAGPHQLMGEDRDAPIVKEYWSAIEAAMDAWSEAKGLGLLPVWTMDGQLGAHVRRPWAPASVVDKLNARSWTVNIDWLIYPKSLVLSGSPRKIKLFDHTGFIAALQPKPTR